ncbi:MAG: hypothetical protein M1839_007463 [Geoglossum umbratile]|nr:MAG: hypothetical protein M1839_007463 [Geoglossum umbratile]
MADHKPSYYSTLKNDVLASKFADLDDNGNYAEYSKLVQAPDTRNFVVDFGNDGAWVAMDIDEGEMKGLLDLPRPTTLATRWINIFAPDRQVKVAKVSYQYLYSIHPADENVQTLAEHYEFSPRLSGLMYSEPLKPVPAVSSNEAPSTTERIKEYTRQKRQQLLDPHQPPTPTAPNAENSIELGKVPPTTNRKRLDMNHYHLASEVWHWSSIDYGKRFLSLGYNWLHSVEARKEDVVDPEEELREELKDVPSGRRLWTWLILCDDGTVISIHEDPFPGQGAWVGDHESRKELLAIRRNISNVFRNLSKSDEAGVTENAISTLHIRKDVGPPADPDFGSPVTDAPSLLFYYLFDDWYTTYSLVVRKKQRQQLREKPGLEQLQDIHQIGRQLAVLKRLYSSYKLIIDRILERQKPKYQMHHSPYGTFDHRFSSPHFGKRSHTDGGAPDSVLGATLSSSAIVRFQRLGDRINLYVLSEIQQCLDEKESLVFMTFNLIAIKESQAVERLTRTTILLAKLTILFLPVSLMTGYFSVQITDLQGVYTHKTYWGCFAVIMFLSIMLLFTFGWISGMVEGRVNYQSLTKNIWTLSMKSVGKERGERKR